MNALLSLNQSSIVIYATGTEVPGRTTCADVNTGESGCRS
jgi:hypothetical protein